VAVARRGAGLLALFTVALAGCGTRLTPTPRGDAGTGADAGVMDASRPDAGWARSGTVTLTLGTWNIEQFPKTATTPRAVREVLELLDADVIGIQEIVDPQAFVALDQALPDWESERVREPYDLLAVGLLYRPDRVRILESRPIFTDDSFAFPRPPLWSRVEAIDDEGRVVFDFELVVVHLKALSDDRSRARRARACRALDTWIRNRPAVGGDEDIVVLGDMNDHLDDVPDENVFLPFLLAPEQYQFLTWPLVEAGESSYIRIPGFIDHILVTRAALDDYGPGTTRVAYVEQTYPGYLPIVSDHRPVLATFVLR